MTDLERARKLAADWQGNYSKEFADRIVEALAAARRDGAERAARVDKEMLVNAYRTGAEEMRELAAQHCTDVIAGWTGRHMAAAIRALPLTPEEP